jgi:putative endopeptidase
MTYQFACGGWIEHTEIAADKPEAMRSSPTSGPQLEYERAMLEQARIAPSDPIAGQLGTFYASCMDEALIDKAGLAPLRPMLAAIDKVKDARSLTAALGALDAAGFSGLFALGPVQDAADARNVIAGIEQGGLGLPDRDYYLEPDEHTRGVLAAYQTYVESLLTAIGHVPRAARQEAADVIALETEIARISKDKVARRDPRSNYHKIDRAGVARAMPRFDWDAFWAAVGLRHIRSVPSPRSICSPARQAARSDPARGLAVLPAFHVASDAAPLLTKHLEDIQFQFTSALTGQPEAVAALEALCQPHRRRLGDLVGQAFVARRFGGDAFATAENQVHAIVAAMTAATPDGLPGWIDATLRRARQARR